MIPFLLAAAGGYLIGSSLKSKQYADGGNITDFPYTDKSGVRYNAESTSTFDVKDRRRWDIITEDGTTFYVFAYSEVGMKEAVSDEIENSYAKGGVVLDKYRQELEVMSDDDLAEEFERETGVSAQDVMEDIEDERDAYIDELVRRMKQTMQSRGEFADGGITQSDKLSLDDKMNFITAYNYAKDRDVFYKGTFAEFKESFSKKAPKSAKYSQKVMNATYNALQQDNSIMAHGGDIRKIKGNNFSQQIENGQRFKALIQKVFDDQKGDRIYPLEYIKATALTPHPIVKIDGKNYISGDAYKGTYSHFEFMDDPNFIKALEYVDRPKIRAKR